VTSLDTAALSNSIVCNDGLYASAIRTASSADSGCCNSRSTSLAASRLASSVVNHLASTPKRCCTTDCA